MKKFADLQVPQPEKGLSGDKIKIGRIFDKLIVVHGFKTAPSKFTGECLYMQISIGDNMHVVFTGSQALIDTIKKIPPENFPFETTIKKIDERFLFT